MDLQAEDLVLRRGGRALVDGVSFELASGVVSALVGPNGAGKSTLIALLAGDERPCRGVVSIGGATLASMRPRALARRRALLPQQNAVSFSMTALEVVLLGRYPYHEGIAGPADRAAVWEALDAVGMTWAAEVPLERLSGGEQLRVQAARVFAQSVGAEGGGVLLLDEPTASLDVAHAALVLRLARSAAARGAAVLVVLHDLNLAARSADNILLLAQGRLIATGSPAAVFTERLIATTWGHPVAILVHPQDQGPLVVPLDPLASHPIAPPTPPNAQVMS